MEDLVLYFLHFTKLRDEILAKAFYPDKLFKLIKKYDENVCYNTYFKKMIIHIFCYY